jgi:hypothetical protein
MPKYNIEFELFGKIFFVRNVVSDNETEAKKLIERQIKFTNISHSHDINENNTTFEYLKNIFGMKF